jgi:hypothetical protein
VNLRVGGNEVRVRLDRAEAEALAGGEPLTHEVQVPGGALAWRVEAGAGPAGLDWSGGTLRIVVGATEVKALLESPPSKDLGIRAEVPVDGRTVALVVEVDLWTVKQGHRKGG